MTFIIPLIILLPLIVGLGIFLAGNKGNALIGVAVGAAALVLALSLLLVAQVSTSSGGDAAAGTATILPRLAFAPEWLQVYLPVSVGGHPVRWQLQIGADGIGALLVLLTGIVGLVTMSLATVQIKERLHQYLALMLITESMLLGVFLSMDLLSFYLFFEAVLLPLVLGAGFTPAPVPSSLGAVTASVSPLALTTVEVPNRSSARGEDDLR